MFSGVNFCPYARAALGVFLFAGISPLSGQTAPRPGVVLPPQTAEQLVQEALARNADLLAARQQLAESQGLLQQAGLRRNPSLQTSYGTGAAFGSPELKSFSVAYNHVFELGNKRQRRVEVSQAGVSLARYDIADRERLLRGDVQVRFAEARAAQINLEVVNRLLQLNQATLGVTVARVQQGESAKLEQGLAAVEVNRLRSDRLLVESRLARALLALKPLLGLPLDSPLTLVGDLEKRNVALDLSTALQAAFAHRPDLLAIRQEQGLRNAEIRAARAEAVPNLVGSASYSRNDDRLPPYGLTASRALVPIRDLDHMLSAGISIDLPLRNRNQGNIVAAEARRESAAWRLRYLEQVIDQEVRSAYNRYQAAQQALQLYNQEILNQAQDNVQILQAAYTAGEVRLLDVLNEERRLVDTQRTYTEVLKEYYLAIVELEQAIGEPLP